MLDWLRIQTDYGFRDDSKYLKTLFRVLFFCSNTAEVRASLKWFSSVLMIAESTHNTEAIWSWSCSYLCQALGGCRTGEARDSHIQDDLISWSTAFLFNNYYYSYYPFSILLFSSLYFFITDCLYQISNTTVNSSAALNQNITINTGLQM